MTDIELAKQHLSGHSICLSRNGGYFTDDARGIAPMMRLLAQGKDLRGYAVADVVVGKAAAMLFVKAGIAEVYAKTMSQSGKAYLLAHGVPCTCEVLTEHIINRTGTDICPMEKAVMDICDVEEGYAGLQNALLALQKGRA